MVYQHLIKSTGSIPLLLLGISVQAQYYYSDLIAAEQTEKKQTIYQQQSVRKINELAILPSGERQTDYQQWTHLSPKADTSQLHRLESNNTLVLTSRFDRDGKLTEQTEKQTDRVNITRYTRNKLGQIIRIENELNDSLTSLNIREAHSWIYNENGRPVRMWKLVEQTDGTSDSTEIRFVLDSTGQITEERTYKKGKETDFLYYYYNEDGLISDIVRYNSRWKRLLPDQLFEYDTDGRMIQRMQLTGTREATYLIWKFNYDRNGLLIEEALFNNLKQHTGSIRYVYEYYQP